MKKIGIICGGYSSEYDISIKSAQTIFNHFPDQYLPFIVILNEKGWFVKLNDELIPIDINKMTFSFNGEQKIDAAIIYVHGDPGENGKIQGLLDVQKIPYVNSGILASALSFDKWYCNQFLNNFNIPVAKSLFLQSINEYTPEEIVNTLGLPVFVKPSDSGSSYGISKVKALSGIKEALEKAFREGETVVIESFLDGTEVTCGVYRKPNGLHALPLTEIATDQEFFDYEAKYLGKSQEITPARVSDEIRLKVQETAKKVYNLLQLKSISRIDFMIVKDVPYVIEVNTTPGFSPASIVPQMIAADGSDIKTFWTEILATELKF